MLNKYHVQGSGLGSGQLWSNDSSEGGTAKLEGMTDQLMVRLEN